MLPTDATPVPSREELLRWDREIVWHAFTQMAGYEPLIFTGGQGCMLTDLNGRQYLDGVSSLWCNVHGHRHPRIDAAIRRQLDQVAHVTSLGASNPTTIALAKRLTELAPSPLSHVFFSSDGSSAVEVALKMAFQYWQQRQDPRPSKTKYVALGGAYHGDTLGSVSVGGVERFHEMFRPLLFDVLRLPEPDRRRGANEEAALQICLAEAEQMLAERHDEIAALVIEPLVQCAAGMVMHPRGYLRGMRELTQRYDVLLIADEVAVGMGRTGTLFACQQEQVAPDFLCLGKGLTGGYLPVAATLTTDTVWQAFLGEYAESKTFFHGHTYGGNPLGCAAALATLDVFDEEQTLARMPDKIEQLERRLADMAEHPHVGDVRQRGLIGAVELVKDRRTGEPFPWQEQRGARVCDFARSQGVWIRPLGNVVVMMPPLCISADQIDRLTAAVAGGIDAATADLGV
ncbi:MAG: adenosylmethionine--8-amino-7-oxononanoate transaminase [Pirellulales bacterium]